MIWEVNKLFYVFFFQSNLASLRGHLVNILMQELLYLSPNMNICRPQALNAQGLCACIFSAHG